jgi:hypothetical protein
MREAPTAQGVSQPASGGWGFVSGRVAVLETALLPRSFFEGLIASKDEAEARSFVGKTMYRAAFSGENGLGNYAPALDAWSAQWRGAARGDCPWHPWKNFWELPERYTAARTAFLRKAARGSGDELAGILEAFAGSPVDLRSLRRHIDIARAGRFAGDTVATSLFLDSACVTLMWAIAGVCAETKAARVLRDKAALQAWSSVLRARWNGTDEEKIRHWFVVEPGLSALVGATCGAGDTDLAAPLVGVASRTTTDFLRARAGDELKSDLDKAMTEAVREEVLDCRRVAFGPERVLSYFAALDVEEANLRIALAAVMESLDRAKAISRLRREYA